MKSYKCNSCGAEVIFNEGNFTNCIYCGSLITIVPKEFSELNIKKIIMFNINENDAFNELNKKYTYSRGDIKEIIKYYIPVRFMDVSFNYYCDYDYIVREKSKDRPEILKRRADLINGVVKKELVIQSNKFNRIIGFHDLGKIQRVDFDPIYLKDVSCDFNLREDFDLNKISDSLVYMFGENYYSFKPIKEIYNSTYNIYNLDVENFTTLHPVYLIKLKGGASYAVSGCINNKEITYKRGDKIKLIRNILIAVGAIGSFYGYLKYNDMLTLASVSLIFIGILLYKLLLYKLFIDYFRNYKFKVHREFYHEKSFKYIFIK